MERAVDDRLGPVREVGEQSSFPVPYYVAATAETTRFSDARCGEFGGGVAADWNAAYVKAVGEALERYAAGVYRESSFRHAPTTGVVDAVPVSAFVRPNDAPTPDPDERVAWTDGADLRDGSYAAVPASFVHFPQPGRAFAPQITTGLGLGNSTDEALAAGLAEVIGSAAGFDAAAAARDACGEALQNWTELDSMGPDRAADQEGAIGRYAEFPTGAREFVDTPATVAARDVTESVPPAERVDELVGRLDDAGLASYAVRLTTSDLVELGLEAVRVVVPAAQPLFTTTPFFGERAETVPRELGFEPRLDRAFHPFP